MKIKTKEDRRHRIQLRQRKRIAGSTERPRLSVFRSVAHIYAQVIDDMSGQTIASASSVEPAIKSAFAPFDERLRLISDVIKPGYARLAGAPDPVEVVGGRLA